MSGPANGVFLSPHPQSVARGAVYITGSALVFAWVGAIVRELTEGLPVAMVVFFRSFAGLIFLLPWYITRSGSSLATTRVGWHLVRAVSGVTAMYCLFFALSTISLAESIVLNFTAPLYIPLVALWFLGERPTGKIIPALLAGFAGVLLIVRPGFSAFQSGTAAGLVSALFAAIALTSARKLSDTEPAARIVLYFGIISSFISFPAAFLVWSPPTATEWLLAALLGALATGGQLLLTKGYASAPAGQVGYFQYSSVIFAALVGWLLWGEIPGSSFCMGALMIVIAGILISTRGFRWTFLRSLRGHSI